MNEVFTAAVGLGAFLNGKPMKVSAVPLLRDGMISTGFPANYDKQLRNLEAWTKVTAHAQSLRRTGSTALNLKPRRRWPLRWLLGVRQLRLGRDGRGRSCR